MSYGRKKAAYKGGFFLFTFSASLFKADITHADKVPKPSLRAAISYSLAFITGTRTSIAFRNPSNTLILLLFIVFMAELVTNRYHGVKIKLDSPTFF